MNEPIEIGQIRFLCREHNVPLKNCGSGRVFSPTYTIAPLTDEEDELSVRMDDDGWLSLDTSELYCPMSEVDDDDNAEPTCCSENWVIEAQ